MSASDLPILYSFRRCPYAIRARLILQLKQKDHLLREVVLRDKPQEMLDISPKGTVPVLQLPDGRVIDESIDVIKWALQEDDSLYPAHLQEVIDQWIHRNDQEFKPLLDRYKYPNRYESEEKQDYRTLAEAHLSRLDEQLQKTGTGALHGETLTLADYGQLPFLRQFAFVDMDWFQGTPYSHVIRWLNQFLDSELFAAVMKKYKQWTPESVPVEVRFN